MSQVKGVNNIRVNLILDIMLFLVFLTIYEPRATGVTIHEWLGAAFVTILVTHVVLHWQWAVNITKRFFKKIGTEPRINYILNAAIFITFTTILFSGLMMSRVLLPIIGVKGSINPFWKFLHSASTDIILLLVAIHIGLHWNWIVNALKRHIVTPVGKQYNYTSYASASKSLGKYIISIGSRTLIILVISGVFALGWYAFSTTPNATLFTSEKTEIRHQQNRSNIMLQENSLGGEIQNNPHQMQGGKYKQSISLAHITAGTVKSIAVVSIVTVIIVFLRKIIRAKA